MNRCKYYNLLINKRFTEESVLDQGAMRRWIEFWPNILSVATGIT